MAIDPNRTQMSPPPSVDPNKTMMGTAPSLNATVTIKPVQCPVCKTFNPPGVMFCVECGLIFDRALPGDAFGAPSVRLPVLVDSNGREVPLSPGPNLLGRQAHPALEDVRVSRKHAEITLEQGQATLRDLGSTNGTTLGGEPVGPTPLPLASGDKISLGGLEFTFSTPGEAAKTLMPPSGRTQQIVAPPTVSTAKLWLVFEDREVPLGIGRHTFGRRGENDVQISDPYVSGRHGVVEVSEDGAYLEDVGSSNGTLLNEARLEPGVRTRLAPGDEIRLGSVIVRVRFAE